MPLFLKKTIRGMEQALHTRRVESQRMGIIDLEIATPRISLLLAREDQGIMKTQ